MPYPTLHSPHGCVYTIKVQGDEDAIAESPLLEHMHDSSTEPSVMFTIHPCTHTHTFHALFDYGMSANDSDMAIDTELQVMIPDGMIGLFGPTAKAAINNVTVEAHIIHPGLWRIVKV